MGLLSTAARRGKALLQEGAEGAAIGGALLGVPGAAGATAGAAYGLGGDRFQDELRFDGEQLNWLMDARQRTDDLYEQLEAMRRGRVYGPAQ